MKDTKAKILEKALFLFNNEGLSKVTLRTIAKELNISQGNLNYHYKKREHIIEALYFDLVKNIDDSISKEMNADNELKLMFNISKAIMTNFYSYRFILLDFSQLMRENNNIKQHYKKLSVLRTQQFTGLINLLISKGILRAEILPNEYENLYLRFQILSDFWMSSAQTTHKKITKTLITKYSEVLNQSIFPYLTKKGLEQYNSVVGLD